MAEIVYSIKCIECDAVLTQRVNLPILTGELIVCPDCGVELEVRAVTAPTAEAPTGSLTVTLAPKEAEDWGE